MGRRLDLYAECNLELAPVDMFTAECCARCMNPDCTRSQYGKSHFEDRVKNWHERMFVNPPRMAQVDSRYAKLAAQNFVLIEPAITVSRSDWGSVPAKPVAPVVVPKAPDPVVVVEPVVEPVVAAPTLVQVEVAPPPPAPEPKPAPKEPPPPRVPSSGPINTPAKPSQMLQNKPPAPPASDWSVPATQQSNAPVVKPGAKIKFGE